MHRYAPALRMMRKITEDHITLTPRLRMRVNLAVQVSNKYVPINNNLKMSKKLNILENHKFHSFNYLEFSCQKCDCVLQKS